MLVVAAAMTSFYSWRLIFMTFFGEPQGPQKTYDHAHESPWTMLVPLGVLALGSIFAGMLWFQPFFGDHERVNSYFGIPNVEHAAAAGEDHGQVAVGEDHGEGPAAAMEEAAEGDAGEAAEALTEPVEDEGAHAAGAAPGAGAIYMAPTNHVMDEAHHAPAWVKVAPFVAMLVGLSLAWVMYIRRPELPEVWARYQPPLYRFLLNKWYFDEIYDAVLVRPAKATGRFLWRRGDLGVIDGGINGLAMGVVPYFTRLFGRVQSGYLFHYAFAMVIGIAILITWMTLAGGAG
jgi:NADH-quinone oxidoreductase subunit L